ACEPVKATNDARRVRFGIAALRDGIGRASIARTPAVADERGPHTRPGDLAPLRADTGTQVSNLIETFTPHPQLPAGRAPIPRAGISYEYRSLTRFAQELAVGIPM